MGNTTTAQHKPQHALNKAFRKVKPNRADFERFKVQLGTLLSSIKENESEEFNKKLIANFLEQTHYRDHFINTKGRNDLVIHEGKTASTPVGVILETKSPSNKSEMLTRDDLNRKALHELVLYYLRERVTHQNTGVKHLIATDTYEWFFFDSSAFEKTFVENKNFVKDFKDFEAKRLSGTKTEFFYSDIAKPFIARLNEPLPFTHVDLRSYQPDSASEKKLITLYKLFSPEHLLKLPFANDSNTLDKTFYAELLHIIGLTETKIGGKKLIVRQEETKRGDASLIENTIIQLGNRDKLSRLAQPGHYGDTREERLFNVALELSITWINRVLFLKLLESQLKSYHKGDEAYAFLNGQRLQNYDDVSTLFFGVLARPVGERHASAAEFEHVPYLNSSLFEPTELEHVTLDMSALRDERELDLFPHTVLKDAQGKRRTGKLSTLAYLFEFLDAYDFSSEGSEAVQEESKTLINASVLGLIFEKINGYKDGSFFTPGFITMYMCRETIRRATLQKFNEVKGWNCGSVADLYNKIDDKREASAIINSLKLCDPAVGSGHFLVSALNELLTLKSELKILVDENGKTLRDYTLEVSNDELVITDGDGELFAYNPKSPESQRVQKTLFHEKQSLIENCLFGVDINPNSIKICRLRLWIELLKHAYYKEAKEEVRQLETLPNIDINIKAGNSLISRFALDADLKYALKKSKLTIEDYRDAVRTYRNPESKEQKREMERIIERIKGDFRTEILLNDPKRLKLNSLRARLGVSQDNVFADVEEQMKEQEQEQAKIKKQIEKLEKEIEEVRSNKIFENAFEWRFEFPEALGERGEFIGFDVILGNPPYIRQETISSRVKEQLGRVYRTYHGSADLLVYFVELGVNLLSRNGHFSYIIANKWMRSDYGKPLRRWLKDKHLLQIIDFGELPVFEAAATFPMILMMESGVVEEQNFLYAPIKELNPDALRDDISELGSIFTDGAISDSNWSLMDNQEENILSKMKKQSTTLVEYLGDKSIYYGIKTGFNGAFIIDEATRSELINTDPRSAEIIKPFIRGNDVRKYQTNPNNQFLIFARRGIDIEKYSVIKKYLLQFKDQLMPKPKDWKGGKWKGRKSGTYEWYEIQDAVDYYTEFEEPKIIYPDIASSSRFTLDLQQYYPADTTFIIPQNDLFLLGVLNSKLIWLYLKRHCPALGDPDKGGRLRLKRVYLSQLPIRTLDLSNPTDQSAHNHMTGLVEKMLGLHQQKAAATGAALVSLEAEIAGLDAEIDGLVYGLYGLSEEEIEVVEASVAG